MKVMVMGAGALGSYLGGCLSSFGHDTIFVARGSQLDVLRKYGLTVRTMKGEKININIHVTDNPDTRIVRDLVLLCVKTYDNPGAIELIRPVIGRDTIVLTFQNGVDSLDELGSSFGLNNVLGGISWANFILSEEGVTEQVFPGSFVIGEIGGGRSNRADILCEVFRKAGIETVVDEDIVTSVWRKFIYTCAVEGLTALTGLPVWILLEYPESKELLVSVMREVEKIARRSGILLSDRTIENILFYLEDELLPEITRNTFGSMYFDIKNGRKLELDAINGSAVRRGSALGVHTPVNNVIYACLKPLASGNRIYVP